MRSPVAQKFAARTVAAVLAPVIFYVFLVANGWLGTDFGRHWDEHLFVEFVDAFHLHGQWIPTLYLYPSFCFWLTLLASFFFRWLHPGLAGMPLLQDMDFSVFSRDVFVAVASLGVVWVYLLTLKITKRLWFSCLAGLIFCGSFEFSYHSRWAVSDLIAAQFAILSTLLLFSDKSLARRVGWSALVAGVAAGTKYTAGIVVLNILLLLASSLQPWKKAEQARQFFRLSLLTGLCFGFAFFVTTPGCVYHLKSFVHDLWMQKSIYAGGHLGYTVTPGWDCFSRIILYYLLVLFSPLTIGSILVCLLGLAGAAYAGCRREWNIFGLFLVMLIYTGYVSLFKVMIVRNLLYVLPYFVVLAAYGLFSLHQQLKERKIVFLADAVLLCVLAVSLSVVVSDTLSIYRREHINAKAELAAYLKENSGAKYIFSSRIKPLLPPQHPSTGTISDPETRLVFFNSEIKEEDFPANRFGVYQTIAGPRDVNFDYYPTWTGQERIVIMKVNSATRGMLDDLGLGER